jgi:hypothetical protein
MRKTASWVVLKGQEKIAGGGVITEPPEQFNPARSALKGRETISVALFRAEVVSNI